MKIELSQNEIDVILAFHRRNILRLQDVIKAAEDEIAESKLRIQEISFDYGVDAPSAQLHNLYPVSAPLWKKIKHLLDYQKRPLTTRELSIEIKKYENIPEESDIISKIAATLIQKVEKGDTFQRIEYRGVYFYGLIDWNIEDMLKKNHAPGLMREEKNTNG